MGKKNTKKTTTTASEPFAEQFKDYLAKFKQECQKESGETAPGLVPLAFLRVDPPKAKKHQKQEPSPGVCYCGPFCIPPKSAEEVQKPPKLSKPFRFKVVDENASVWDTEVTKAKTTFRQ